MPFVNGFPTEEDIKIKLYYYEPEQISDLIYCPLPSFVRVFLSQLMVDPNKSKRLEVKIWWCLPFSVRALDIPMLFQRFNPYNKPFADEYSKKLFDFLQRYNKAYFFQAADNRFLKFDSNGLYREFNEINYKIYNTYIFEELEINLPNNGLSIDYSHYRPEYKEDLVDGYVWTPIIDGYLDLLLNEFEKAEIKRIDNDCIRTQPGRAWLLNFETHSCNGQNITIRDDILIGSLVITFNGEWSQEDKDYILNQIPNYYLYENLDNFFNELHNEITNQEPLWNPDFYLLTSEEINYSFNYYLEHYYQVTRPYIISEFTQTINNVTFYPCATGNNEFDPNSKIIARVFSEQYSIGNQQYIVCPLNFEQLKSGLLIHANNNNWNNNYVWINNLTDIDNYIYLDRTITYQSGQELRFLPYGLSYAELGIVFNRSRFDFRTINFNYNDLTDTVDLDMEDNNLFKYTNDTWENDGYFHPDTLKPVTNWAFTYCFFKPYSSISKFTRLLYNAFDDIRNSIYLVGNTVITHNNWLEATDNNTSGVTHYNKQEYTFDYQINNQIYTLKLDFNTDELIITETNNNKTSLGEDITITKQGEIYDIDCVKWAAPNGLYNPTYPYATNTVSPPGSENFINNGLTEEDELIVRDITLNDGRYIDGQYKQIIEVNSPIIRDEHMIQPIDNIFDDSFDDSFIYNYIPSTNTIKEILTRSNEEETYNFIVQAHEDCYKVANCDLEDIKKDIKEIHAALDAGKFAYLDGSTEQQRVSNIGYYVERMARVLGISVNSDGSIRSIRQSKIIEKGDTVPNGWNIAQWGRNNGENTQGQEGGLSSEERDGIAWEIKSNKFIVDNFTGEPTEIAQGGYALVENIPQLLHLIFEDLDRAFGLQDAGANVVPSPDGKQIVSYQGINTMLLDILYMLSQMSRNTSGAHICGLKNQAMLQEVLGALGQPIGVKEIGVTVADGQQLPIPVPGTLPGNPTLSDMFMIILLNLGLLVGSKIDVKPEEDEKKKND